MVKREATSFSLLFFIPIILFLAYSRRYKVFLLFSQASDQYPKPDNTAFLGNMPEPGN